MRAVKSEGEEKMETALQNCVLYIESKFTYAVHYKPKLKFYI